MSAISSISRILVDERGRCFASRYFYRLFGLVSRHWERKKFYRETTIYQTEDNEYGVCLDQRKLRTPLRKIFSVPTDSLAMAVAHEWQTQTNIVQPALMHLTALCNTVIDNPLNKTQDEVVLQAMQYLSSDTICFRSDTDECLLEQQNKEWNPVLNWFNDRFNGNLSPTTSLVLDSPSYELCRNLSSYLKQLDMWSLTGFSHSLDSTSSVVLSCALMEEKIDPLEASLLTHLEIRYQIGRWGKVEWQHDVEAHDLLSRLSASLVVSRLSKPPKNL